MYSKMLRAAFQWMALGAVQYLATARTALAISGRVDIDSHIKLPTNSRNGQFSTFRGKLVPLVSPFTYPHPQLAWCSRTTPQSPTNLYAAHPTAWEWLGDRTSGNTFAPPAPTPNPHPDLNFVEEHSSFHLPRYYQFFCFIPPFPSYIKNDTVSEGPRFEDRRL